MHSNCPASPLILAPHAESYGEKKENTNLRLSPKDFILTEWNAKSRKATLNKLLKLRRVVEAAHPPLAEKF